MNFPREEKYGAIMAELPYMAIFLSAAINNFHIFLAIYGYGHYGVPIPGTISINSYDWDLRESEGKDLSDSFTAYAALVSK